MINPQTCKHCTHWRPNWIAKIHEPNAIMHGRCLKLKETDISPRYEEIGETEEDMSTYFQLTGYSTRETFACNEYSDDKNLYKTIS